MKKIFAMLVSVLMIAGLTTAAMAFEKDVDYSLCEELYADTYNAFGEAYPASVTEGWPACTTGSLLTGTVITGVVDGKGSTEGNYAYKAFDGDVTTFFEQFEMSPRSYVGLILDQAYELTEVRIKPSTDRPVDRMHGLLLQGSNDGELWQTILYFRQDAAGMDYHIFTPQPVTEQAYIDAGYGTRQDNSFFWVAKDASYSMYRVTNPNTGLTIAMAELELYGVPKEATVLDERELANRRPGLYYYPGNIVESTAVPASVDGNLVGTIIGGGWVWNRGTYNLAFDNNKKTAYDSEYIGHDCWVGMKFDEPYALTSVKVMPKRAGYGHMEGAQLQGSLDGINWKTLVQFTIDDVVKSQDYVTKEITDPAGYKYFRYISSATGYEASDMGECEVAELLFYGAPAAAAEEFTVTPTPIANLTTYEGEIIDLGIQNVSVNGSLVGDAIRAGGRFLNRSNATWEYAFDGDLGTTYGKAESNTYDMDCWVGLRMAEPTVATYVSYVPKSNGLDQIAGIHIQGSVDGVHWNTLAQYGFEDVPTEQTAVVKEVSDPTAYTYFRVISNQVRGLNICEFGIYSGDGPVEETAAPETAAPETAAPETATPETAAPETDAPETNAPETAAPETAAPETDAPAKDTGGNTTAIIVIVDAIAVVAVVAGVLRAKRKK